MSPTLLDTLEQSIDRRDLLRHPFYQAWSAGTLPAAALKDYARDWGGFIGVIDQGWNAVGQPGYAAEERIHAELWEHFAAALQTAAATEPEIEALAALKATAERLFADPVTALGALYAFEAQQPGTSLSKLTGLRKHYHLGRAAEQYFVVHADDYAEAQWLQDAMEKLGPADQARCAAACEELCHALWQALSEIYNEECVKA